MRFKISNSSLIWWHACLFFTLFFGCSKESSSVPAETSSDGANSKDKITLVLNWYPEAEHGGYYAALVHGIFEKHGLNVEIRPGGKTTIVPQELTLGRIEFGIGNADDVLIAREQKAPLVALMAPMQDGPRCIMVREDSGITSFEDLKNVILQIDPSRPYVPYMKKKGLLQENVTTVPYFGTVAQFVAQNRTVQQAYSFSEPLMAQEQGVEVRTLMMSDIGYNPYASVLMATESYIHDHPDVTRSMVKACIEGWAKYLKEPAETNQYILAQNREGITGKALDFGVKNLRPLCLPRGMNEAELGHMTSERWATLAEQLADLEMISKDIDPAKAFTLEFLP